MQFPVGGGECGELVRRFDWSTTPLGPIEGWSASLRAVVQMVVHQKQGICLYWGPELSLIYNEAYARMLGKRHPHGMGRPFQEVWSDVWDEIKPFIDTALSGEGTFSEDLPLIMTRNGFEEETYWTFSYSPLFDDDGSIAGMINVAVDTTASVLASRTQDALRRELQHRLRNSLAVTSAVVGSTLRNAESLEEARRAVDNRIGALATAQNFTEIADTADLRAVIESSARPLLDRPERLTLDGPAVPLTAPQALGISLATYELATNAIKHGALSLPEGVVEVRWTLDGQSLRLSWEERGGPPVTPPSRRGFGVRLTSQIVPSYFLGTGEPEYEPTGYRYRLRGTIGDPSA